MRVTRRVGAGLIDRAAKLVGKNRTDFVLDAARHSAEDALLDRTAFEVSPKAYAEFLARLANTGALGVSVSLAPPEPLADHHTGRGFHFR
jgi:uncharacterized protein (DUF1778 family)